MRFPGGSFAAGLLLLRAAIGLTVIIQGWAYLAGREPPILSMIAGGSLMLTGTALVIGLFTAMAGVGVALVAVATAFSWLPAPAPNLLNGVLPAAFVAVVAFAVVLMGPGAWSVDARLFGYHEIMIPPMPQSFSRR